MIICIAKEEDVGKRLDVFLSQLSDLSRSQITKMLDCGLISHKGHENLDKKMKIKLGDTFYIEEPDPTDIEAKPENIPLSIVYEDDDIIVIDKPKGMVVHPAPGNEHGTLVNALLYHCKGSLSGINGKIRPGIVHRIDKDTSGLLVVAKNDNAHRSLAEQLEYHGVSRVYHLITIGGFQEPIGTIHKAIGRHPVDRKKMAILPLSSTGAKDAITHYEVLEAFSGFSYVKCKLETGRTHQIRVHMSSIGHPLLGDEVYGGNRTSFEKEHKKLLQGQCLHAKELTLIHPVTGKEMHFVSSLPENFEKLLNILRSKEI